MTDETIEQRKQKIAELQQALEAVKEVVTLLEARAAAKNSCVVRAVSDNRFADRISSGMSKVRTIR